MSKLRTHDVSFRTERSGKAALATDNEHIIAIISRLFHMRPGDDQYNPDCGLNILDRLNSYHVIGNRDSDLENDIKMQLETYTDITPLAIYALHISESDLNILINVRIDDSDFSLGFNISRDSEGTLKVLLAK